MNAAKLFRGRIAVVLAGLLALTQSAVPAGAVTLGDLMTKPAISTPDPTKYKYVLVWYNHFEPDKLYEVMLTNPETSTDDLENGENSVFKSWCHTWTPDWSKVHAMRIVGQHEHFQSDYDMWVGEPYNLPKLWTRLMEIEDNEVWFVAEIAK